jgi:hypothetical protein
MNITCFAKRYHMREETRNGTNVLTMITNVLVPLRVISLIRYLLAKRVLLSLCSMAPYVQRFKVLLNVRIPEIFILLRIALICCCAVWMCCTASSFSLVYSASEEQHYNVFKTLPTRRSWRIVIEEPSLSLCGRS